MESIVGSIPPWLEPVKLADWPTRPFRSERLGYGVDVPEPWPGPEQRELPTHLEHVFRGPTPCDGLLVQFMAAADPSAELRGWAEAPLTLTGMPAVTLALSGGDPAETLEWSLVEASDSLTGRFGVDEIHLYAGLARMGESGLSRLYTVLARRGALAWHVGLALESDLAPGAPLELVERADHVRAGGTLGTLRFG